MFSFLSRKKEGAKPMELGLDEVEGWLRKENSDFIAFLESEIKEFYKRLDGKISGLRNEFHRFRESQVNPEAVEKLRRAAQTNKLIIEKSMVVFLGSVSPPADSSFAAARKFSESLASKIAEIGKKNRRCFLIVREALNDSTRGLMHSIGELEKENLELLKMLDEKGGKVVDTERIIELAKSLKADIERSPVLEKETKSLEGGVDFQKQKVDSLKREVENLGGGREMQKLRESESEIRELESKRKEVDERIKKEMSNFEKALKKISHGSRGKLASNYIENPAEALDEPEGLKKFRSLLPALKEAADRGEISGKVREKALLGLERAESGVLDWALKERKDLESKLSDCRKKMEKNSVVREKREKEKEAENWNQTIEKTKKRITDLRKEKDLLARRTEDEKKELEKRLKSLSGKEVKVTF